MTRVQRLTEVFVEVANSLTGDFGVIEFLQQLCERCVELLDVDAAGILLADQRDRLMTIAASDERTHVLELFALQHDQGPCVDCHRTGTARVGIDLTDLKVASEWQAFATQAREVGFVAANAIPMRRRGRVIGTLGLFQSTPGRLSADDILLAQALADVATVAILQQRTLEDSETERGQLQSALTSRIAVEQAKGVLSERWQLPLDDAFTAFRTYARAHRLRLAELAGEIASGQFDTDRIPHPDAR
ncbi:GAF and ANTAR domain-containing protein [Streptomyces sp. NRRL B-24484]|uniref:GAF and ANTAR domain-containing protein n=1 Tax=Streptomyces sp. NRRL B-24484 TaxID=1463833 RepID=UPI0004C06DF6|nr:GAF and ANTAR domain-containing protein [Streptomyces sp. NRRL B-24484]